MKKIIVGVAILIVAFVAKADYLYWGVTTADAGTTYNAARLYASATGGVKGDAIGWIYSAPGSASTDVSSYANNYFYVELCNYDGGVWTSTTSEYSQDQAYSYSSLVSQGVITSSDLIAQASVAAAVLRNSGVQATPEPTSGLLMLMGFAMLGLKRKKEV